MFQEKIYILNSFTINGNNIEGINIYVYYREFKYEEDGALTKIEESEKEKLVTIGEPCEGFEIKDSGNNAVIHELGLKIQDEGKYLTDGEIWNTEHTYTFTLENANDFFNHELIIT